MRSVSLASAFFKVQAAHDLQYRANFVLQLINSAVALFTGLVAVSLVFQHTDTLAGWSRPELLIVMGTHIVLGGVIASLIEPNMRKLMEDVEQGDFDFVLVRPADPQLLVSIRNFRLWNLIDVVVGAVVVVSGFADLPVRGGAVRSVAFLAAAALGVVVMYCMWLILSTLTFRIVKGDEIIDLFQGVYQAGRWPVSIYPNWLRGSLTFVVPLAFAVTVPAETLSARIDPSFLVVGLGITAAVVAITRLIWRANLAKYSGASG
jgi:ABC-2 type transport system permease protein